MNRNPALRRLFWKECQQLWPLVSVLLVMGTVLLVFLRLTPALAGISERYLAVVFGLPVLSAVGAGALLIGQDKELGTLRWLHGLPIRPRDIVAAKLLASLLGLTVVWCGSLALGFLVTLVDPAAPWHTVFRADRLWIVPGHCLFLLLAGVTLAWRMRSAPFSLLVLLPVATTPLLAANLIEWLAEATTVRLAADASQWRLGLCLLVAIAIALWDGWRSGHRSLTAQAPGKRWWPGTRPADEQEPAPALPVRDSPGAMLVWQFAVQNRRILTGLILLLLVASCGLRWIPQNLNGAVGALTVTTILLAWSWLGLLVFQGDSVERRILFLADRGISPWQVWATRQLIPSSIVACSLVMVAAAIHWGPFPVTTSFSTLTAMAVLGLFLTTQWFGQCISSPIVGAILAPLVGGAAVAYFSFVATTLPAPRWVLLSAGIVPLFATRVMTRHWMDGRTGWGYRSVHASMLGLFLFIPTTPFLMFAATYPVAPQELTNQLATIARENTSTDHDAVVFTRSNPRSTGATPHNSRAERLEAIEQRLRANPHAVPDPWSLQFVIADLEVARLAKPAAPGADFEARYTASLRLLLRLRERLRNSRRLLDQDHADAVETWLLAETEHPAAREEMGEGLHRQVVTALADRDQRFRARRRAIALSWLSAEGNSLGGYEMQSDIGPIKTVKDRFIRRRNADLISTLLLQRLTAVQAERHRLDSRLLELFHAGPRAREVVQSMTDASAEMPGLLLSQLFQQRVPGLYWQGTWEQTAERLSQPNPSHNQTNP